MTVEEAKQAGYELQVADSGVRLVRRGQVANSWPQKTVEKVFDGKPPTLDHPAVQFAIQNCEESLARWNQSVHQPDDDAKVDDDELLQFVQNKCDSLSDVTPSEANLVEDIWENGERELQPSERRMILSMMKRFKQNRKK